MWPFAGGLLASPALEVNAQGPQRPVKQELSQNTYSTYEINANGMEYENQPDTSSGFTDLIGDWLTSGVAANVWVQHTGGTFDLDPGSGRLRLNVTRRYRLEQLVEGITSVTVTFNFWDAESGGNLIHSFGVTMSAQRSEP